ncbi:MAG: right-handed parallel beta-helix repeat-containing protein [Trebonia sp.]
MRKIPIALGAVASLLAFGAAAGAAQASAGSTVYVSPRAASTGAGTSCWTASYSNINAAVAAVGPGGTVVVCPGTYDEEVVVTKPLNLVGRHARIDAKGQPPLKVAGMTLPGSDGIAVLQTSNVSVSGFTVTGAGFDAILVGASSNVSVSRNTLVNNGTFVNLQQGGSGVGVDINSSSWSSATGNVAVNNQGGGFEIADDIGPASHDTVAWNYETRSYDGCGVFVAGHSAAGVTDNLVAHNSVSWNGTAKGTGASGLLLASEVPGETMTGNTFAGNSAWDNGLAGMTIHVHLPGQHFNGNKVIGNWIGTNNLVGDPIDLVTSPTSQKNVAVPDLRTTGILAATASQVSGTVIAGNHITDNHFGIFLEALQSALPSPVSGLSSNSFHHVHQALKEVTVP